ncbi:Uncharacterised protein [Vibrio cholerae]|nr:Uncharacterised protein [Vibrio cholerae]
MHPSFYAIIAAFSLTACSGSRFYARPHRHALRQSTELCFNSR